MYARGKRNGLLPDDVDRHLFVLTMFFFTIDLTQMSIWTGDEKPFAFEQRMVTVVAQMIYLALNVIGLRDALLSRLSALPVIIFCGCSSLWSDDPGTSLGSALRLFLLIFIITVAQHRHTSKWVLLTLKKIFGTILIINLTAIAFPQLSIMTGTLAGAFRGFMDHKQTLGVFCGLYSAFLLPSIGSKESRQHYYEIAGSLFVLGVLVILSHSSTCEALCILTASLTIAFKIITRVGLPILSLITCGTLFMGSWAVIQLGYIDTFEILGRNDTLTDRTLIWDFIAYYISLKPWIGYGFSSFPLAHLLQTDTRWGAESFVVGTTHNSYLAIVTEIGYIGLGLYAVWIISMLRHCLNQLIVHRCPEALLIFVVYIASGMSESLSGLAPGFVVAALVVACPSMPIVKNTRRDPAVALSQHFLPLSTLDC